MRLRRKPLQTPVLQPKPSRGELAELRAVMAECIDKREAHFAADRKLTSAERSPPAS